MIRIFKKTEARKIAKAHAHIYRDKNKNWCSAVCANTIFDKELTEEDFVYRNHSSYLEALRHVKNRRDSVYMDLIEHIPNIHVIEIINVGCYANRVKSCGLGTIIYSLCQDADWWYVRQYFHEKNRWIEDGGFKLEEAMKYENYAKIL